MKSKFSYIGIVAIVGTMLFFASCTRDRNTPGRAYMANFDMYYSKAYDYYSPNPNFKNGQTAQAPVAGTISRGDMPYPFTNSVAGSDSAAKLVNPILFTKADLARGKEKFDIYCAVCHNTTGDGKGTLFTSGKFIAQPRDLTSPRVQTDLNDGQLYHVISVGTISGLMGPHGDQVLPADRWRIVNYIKNQFSVNPK
ncbi:MAG: hypothetical protein RIS47_1801 [Bacteroidota bacterium]